MPDNERTREDGTIQPRCMLEGLVLQQLHLYLIDIIFRVEVEEDKVDLSVSIFVKGDVSCDATVRHIPYPGRHLKNPIQAFSMKMKTIGIYLFVKRN